jgi:hypothetical protein
MADTYTPNGPIAGARYADRNGSTSFPWDLVKQPYWMSFSFYEYKAIAPNVSNLQQLYNKNANQNIYFNDMGTIRLPLPNSMVDDQQVNYQAEPLTPNIQMNKTASDVASVVSGSVLNPLLTVMFKSPAFKKFNFDWKLAPSNANESRTVNSIINTFKYNMLPGTGAGGTLLTYPNIVQITISANSPDYFTYVFKPAVIESFSVNYTPSGQPSFFGATYAPTEVQIRLGIMEIEYWLASDYGADTRSIVDGAAKTARDSLGGWLQAGLSSLGF